MRNRVTALAAGMGIVCTVAAAGCATSIGTVDPARRHGPLLVVDAARDCPRSVGKSRDVGTSFSGDDSSLLPRDRKPTSALMCAYEAAGKAPMGTRLVRTVRLGEPASDHLAAGIANVSLAKPDGEFSCPGAFFGSYTILAFDYPDRPNRPIDLWYDTSGCRTLDNGTVEAFQGANPSFYSGFEPSVDPLLGSR